MKSSYTIRRTSTGATISAKGAAAQALFDMLTKPQTPEQQKLADMVVSADAPPKAEPEPAGGHEQRST